MRRLLSFAGVISAACIIVLPAHSDTDEEILERTQEVQAYMNEVISDDTSAAIGLWRVMGYCVEDFSDSLSSVELAGLADGRSRTQFLFKRTTDQSMEAAPDELKPGVGSYWAGYMQGLLDFTPRYDLERCKKIGTVFKE